MLRFTIFLVVMTSTCLNFTTADDFCSLSALKVHARVACRKLYERYPRHTDLSKDGYEIEKISETTRHKRHHIINSNHKEYAKKITHPDFPKGGYLLVHHPYSQLVTSSSQSLHAHNHHHSSSTENIKPTQNSHNHQNYLSNEIDAPRHKKHKKHNQDHFTNEILIRDMESLSGHNSENIKNKYDLRFKRHNQHNAISLDHCCNTNCDWLLCSDDFDE